MEKGEGAPAPHGANSCLIETLLFLLNCWFTDLIASRDSNFFRI